MKRWIRWRRFTIRETEESTKKLTNMMEPAMTIIVALVMGTVVIAIVLPMFSMYGVVAGG
ncbi:MAG TPA: hypothetical protein VHP54_07010 [Caproiciproducens sp.]|nr:hypothetical protein [Caproiciproducens sp.]